MGVMNVTPDSFSGDGLLATGIDPGERVRALLAAGADLVDIGGESTRPGHTPVGMSEELRRVLPAVEAAVGAGAMVSVDTRKATVAARCVEAGAVVVNDVSGLADDEMVATVAATDAYLVLLHCERYDGRQPVISWVREGLEALIERALRSGMREERLILDPGLGFGRSWRQNLEIVRDLGALRSLGRPILIGPSRKATISAVLGVGAHDRLEGTLALVSLCAAAGADMVRVHDVEPMARAVRTIDALLR